MQTRTLSVFLAFALGQEVVEERRGLLAHEEGAFDGYTLFSPLTGDSVLLVDMKGEVVHRWETGTPIEAGHLLDDGKLLCWGIASVEKNPRFQGPGVDGGLVQLVDWDGKVLWNYVLDDDYQLLHHDVERLPNGNLLFLAWEHRYREDAVEWGRDPAQIGEAGMWPDAIYEIAPTLPEGGEVVWEWHVWDHIVQDHDPSKTNHGSVADSPGRVDINIDHRSRPAMTPGELQEQEELEREMAALGYGGAAPEEDEARTGTVPDWLHTNAIDHHPEYDLIVLSSPAQSELWVIDHSTTTEQAAGDSGGRWGKGGELLWRWGNARNYGAGDDSDRKLFFQHNPTWLSAEKPGELRLLVFNNGQGRPGGEHSSVDELVLPFEPAQGFLREEGRPFGPQEPAWSFSAPGEFYSSFISGAQRLSNGNTLICSGAQGRIFEVTRDKKIVWDYRSPHAGKSDLGIPSNAIYRARRIPRDHPGLAGREL